MLWVTIGTVFPPAVCFIWLSLGPESQVRSQRPQNSLGHSSSPHLWGGKANMPTKGSSSREAESDVRRRNFRLFKPTLLSPLRKVTELVFYPIIRGWRWNLLLTQLPWETKNGLWLLTLSTERASPVRRQCLCLRTQPSLLGPEGLWPQFPPFSYRPLPHIHIHYASLCPKEQEAPYQQADPFQIQVNVLGENSPLWIVYNIVKATVIKKVYIHFIKPCIRRYHILRYLWHPPRSLPGIHLCFISSWTTWVPASLTFFF